MKGAARQGRPSRSYSSSPFERDWTFSSRSCITPGSRSVVTSPSSLPSAMSRRSRRMILPERVFGRSPDQMIFLRHVLADLLLELLAALVLVALERHERDDGLAGVLVLFADHGALGDLLER